MFITSENYVWDKYIYSYQDEMPTNTLEKEKNLLEVLICPLTVTSTNSTRKSIFVLKRKQMYTARNKKIGKCIVPSTNNNKHDAQVPGCA